jgi:hypothetical protein
MINSSAAAGSIGAWLKFVNAGTDRCQLQGWPTVVAVTADGAMTVAQETSAELSFPLISGVPAVSLDNGDAAVAAFAGSDTPGPQGSCPPAYRSLRITPPGNTESVELSAWIPYFNNHLPACTGIGVTMVVRASAVPFLNQSPGS